MIAAMDAVGVDAAILVSVFTMYRFDSSYAEQVYRAHPTRFRLIKPVDPTDPAVNETIDQWVKTPGTVAIRIMLNRGVSEDAADPGINRVLAAAARHNIPVNLLCWGRLDQVKQLAARNPDTRIVVDHLGLEQPYEPPLLAQPFREIEKVLALAQHPNVVIKITGACTLSQKAYPYPDIWDPLARIFDAYGMERCLWGTDWTRAVQVLTYQQGVDAFKVTDRLTHTEREALMGGNVQTIYRCHFH
jgi:predicted TIM-barrel fold metal-dependent hydrolase